jgi:imidazolonepropionase-like amidohydrolase
MLGFHDRAVIAPGKRADLILLRHSDFRELAYELGGDPVRAVIVHGQVARYFAT